MNTEGHLLGTDNYGRDLFSRLVYGTRISMIVGIAAVLFGAVFGTLLGLVAGYFGGRIDSIIMRTMDGLFRIPIYITSYYINDGIRARTCQCYCCDWYC